MPITAEWAKQLALACIGKDLDFARMKVVNTQQRTCVIPVMKPVRLPVFSWDTSAPTIDTETIEMRWRVRDNCNHEEHVIGYGPQTNTLVVFGEPKEFTLEELLDRLSEAINRIDCHAHGF